MTEKNSCSRIDTTKVCSEWCPGILDSSVVTRYGKSILVSVCANPDYLGTPPTTNEADEILVYCDRPPTHEEYVDIAEHNIK